MYSSFPSFPGPSTMDGYPPRASSGSPCAAVPPAREDLPQAGRHPYSSVEAHGAVVKNTKSFRRHCGRPAGSSPG